MPEPTPLPPIVGEPLSLLLAASNNGPLLAEVVGAWVAQLEKRGKEFEILLVDDGSSDGSADLAADLAQREPRLRVLTHPAPRGLGAVLRTGLAESRFPLFAYTTCDRQYQPADFQKFLGAIDKVHLVSGYRAGRRVPWPLRGLGLLYRLFLRIVWGEQREKLPGWLGWSGHFRRFLARWLFGVRAQDVDCAFRLFRRAIFDRIPIQSDGTFAQVEILAKANFLGCLTTEEPVTYRPDPARPRSPWRQTLREALRVLRHPDFGPPLLPPKEPEPAPAAPP